MPVSPGDLSLDELKNCASLNYSKSLNGNFTAPQQAEFKKLGDDFFFQLKDATRKQFSNIPRDELKKATDSLSEYTKKLEDVLTQQQATAKFFADAAAVVSIIEDLVSKAALIGLG
jgi:hypothetical protein